MKLDVREKKPALWDLLILTCGAALLCAAVLRFGGEKAAVSCAVIADVFLLCAVVMLVRAFFRQIEYNLYSYNTIYYMGFALFLFAVFVSCVLLTAEMIRHPDVYTAVYIVHTLVGSAKNYMLFTSPFILVFSAALCISNISLIRHEGKRLVNVLGIILSCLLVGGLVLLYAVDFYVSGSQTYVMIHELITNTLAAVYLYIECMLIGTIIANLIAVRRPCAYDRDFLIILGCGIRKDGTPTPLLRGRIDRAVRFRNEQLEKTGKDLVFITSGGQGPNEVISESASMKRYLLSQGIPADRIIEEDRSTNTFENMKYSKEKITEEKAAGKVAFSTTNYHVFRSGLFARRTGMRAVGMGAKTKWYFWPNAAVREFVGLLTEHRGKQALILGGMIAAYIGLTLWSYLYL